MQKLATGMRDKAGFTLLEILVVIVIISIAATFTVMAFGDFGQSRQARVSAEQFVQYLTLLQEKAILENQLLGMSIERTSYQAKRFSPANGWEIISHRSSLYRAQPLPSKLQFQFKKANINEAVDIIIQSSGDISPFSLYIGSQDNPKMIQISSTDRHHITIDD